MGNCYSANGQIMPPINGQAWNVTTCQQAGGTFGTAPPQHPTGCYNNELLVPNITDTSLCSKQGYMWYATGSTWPPVNPQTTLNKCCWNRLIQDCSANSDCDTGGEGCVTTGTNTAQYGTFQCNTCKMQGGTMSADRNSCILPPKPAPPAQVTTIVIKPPAVPSSSGTTISSAPPANSTTTSSSAPPASSSSSSSAPPSDTTVPTPSAGPSPSSSPSQSPDVSSPVPVLAPAQSAPAEPAPLVSGNASSGSSDAKTADAKTADAKTADAKTADTKTTDTKSSIPDMQAAVSGMMSSHLITLIAMLFFIMLVILVAYKMFGGHGQTQIVVTTK